MVAVREWRAVGVGRRLTGGVRQVGGSGRLAASRLAGELTSLPFWSFLSLSEPMPLLDCSSSSWRVLAACCGWDVPDKKSPPPAAQLRVLGAWADLSPLPGGPATLAITKERVTQIRKELKGVRRAGRLLPAHAGRIYGKLGFSCSQLLQVYDNCLLL